MKTIKTHVDSDCTTIVTCPFCNSQKRTSVASLKHKRHVLKVRCSCKTVFRVLLDYRSHYRKSVRLSGTYTTLYQYHKCKGLMQITDVSAGGLQYHLVGLNRLFPGCILDLEFQLDDKQRSQIKKQGVIRHVCDNVVGCEFVDKKTSDKALAFYLRF